MIDQDTEGACRELYYHHFVAFSQQKKLQVLLYFSNRDSSKYFFLHLNKANEEVDELRQLVAQWKRNKTWRENNLQQALHFPTEKVTSTSSYS